MGPVDRLLVTVRDEGRQLVVDLTVVVAWLILGTELLRLLGVPRWAQYVVLFSGVILYTQVTHPESRPPTGDG